jgi:hypothetical protein
MQKEIFGGIVHELPNDLRALLLQNDKLLEKKE